MQNKYNVLIIGAGNISSFFDNPNSSSIITHAKAFTKNSGFNLLGFFDVNKEKASLASSVWGGVAFHDLTTAFCANKIDVVSVAVPDEFHFDILKQTLEYEPKLIFLEKPITKTLEEANEIRNLLKNKKTNILVNYSRRFVEEFELIRNEISSGQYGNFITGTCYYGKGILHNGSHVIQLIKYLLGDIKEIKVIQSINDFYEDDPSVTAELTLYNNSIFRLNAIDCKNYSICAMDMFFEKGRISFEDSNFLKLEKFEVKENELFKGYKNLVENYNIESENDTAMENAVKNIHDFLESGEELKCTFEEGYSVLKTCLQLQKCNN